MNEHVTVDERLGEMLSYALRYAIGRQTYAPHAVVEYVEPLVEQLDTTSLRCMHRDIADAASRPGGLGDDRIDVPDWTRLQGKIARELKRRKTDENA